MKIRTCLAIGGWMILALAVAQQKEQAGRGPKNTMNTVTPELRIMMINDGYQNALEDLAMTEMRTIQGRDANGKAVTLKIPAKFGFSRVPTFTVLHNGVVRNSKVPMGSPSNKFDLQFFGLSEFGKPLQAGSLKINKEVGVSVNKLKPSEQKEIVDFAEKALPQLLTIDEVRGKVYGRDAVAKPLRLTKKECLKCHTDSKVGDPLAVMVYAVKKGDVRGF